jgi:DNA-binding NarL/FixJ family response regulator
MKPTVVIAEDDFVLLEGALRPAISNHFDVLAAVGDGLAAIEAVERYRPEVVLLDVSMPRQGGFDAARQIMAAHPECKVVFVSNYWDSAYIAAAKEMGAGGYVFKSRILRELPVAIHTALSGQFYQSAV